LVFAQIEGKLPPALPPKRGQLMMVPDGVRPQLQRTAIEVVLLFAHSENLTEFCHIREIILSNAMN